MIIIYRYKIIALIPQYKKYEKKENFMEKKKENFMEKKKENFMEKKIWKKEKFMEKKKENMKKRKKKILWKKIWKKGNEKERKFLGKKYVNYRRCGGSTKNFMIILMYGFWITKK